MYLGDHQVIHYQGVSAGIHSGQIAITTLAEFSQGRGYRIQHHSARAFNREESIDRAYSRLGEAHYSTLFNNCEHFVLWYIEGFHYS
ncbi:lecithin retinol acyltransferase family protein, partial [Aeromonas hydrophila]|uniref:lecithin retinol acyltransferase family protein n=1 Tax=Aeromonas hydrophila TaxID=644 RepID=UPI0035A27F30